mmetsp:Transcript_65565/g.207364  ORF Transcript_65565/g.207364 Transcript_65565/m.207364 type:complete len:174 (+) Transcript_65565:1164-1685(+)
MGPVSMALASPCCAAKRVAVPSYSGMRKAVLPTRAFAAVPKARRSDRSQRMVVRADFDAVQGDAFDFDKILLVVGGIVGLGVGIALPAFFGKMADASDERGNEEPCFACSGTGSVSCRFCEGQGVVRVDLGNGTVDESECINCGGKGTITCNNCNGTGIQPRYLDRREFQDDD